MIFLQKALVNSFINKLLFICRFLTIQSPIIHASAPSKTDRWLEIDLYFSEQTYMQKSVNQFWDRFAPLLEGVNGWTGVILNVGWISDYVFEWHCDLKKLSKLLLRPII